MKKNTIIVQGQKIGLNIHNEQDYISLTDIAKRKNIEEPRYVIQNWMKSRNTIEFLGAWENIYNPDFNRVEFDTVKNESGSNSFYMTPSKWIEATKGIGIISKAGKTGGTYAHKDIAFKFASWISVEFELYIIQEFQRLKADEQEKLSLGWNVKRELAKVNYKIHTDAIKSYLLPTLGALQKKFAYANEADFLNVLVFGKTAQIWQQENPDTVGNIRDYASALDLVILSNIENFNAEYIEQGFSQEERYLKLRDIIFRQRNALENKNLKKLEN